MHACIVCVSVVRMYVLLHGVLFSAVDSSSSDEGQPVVFCEAEESPQRMAFMEIATRVKDFLENVDRTGGQQEPSITME